MKSTWPTQKYCIWDPTQPLFYWLALGFCVGGNANFMFRVGDSANISVFRYQHVTIPNSKLWRWGSKPTPGPNANGFAPQWNIGLKRGARQKMVFLIHTHYMIKFIFNFVHVKIHGYIFFLSLSKCTLNFWGRPDYPDD